MAVEVANSMKITLWNDSDYLNEIMSKALKYHRGGHRQVAGVEATRQVSQRG